MTASQIPFSGTAVVVRHNAAESADTVFEIILECREAHKGHTKDTRTHTHVRIVVKHPYALAWHRLLRSTGQHSEHNDRSKLKDSSSQSQSLQKCHTYTRS